MCTFFIYKVPFEVQTTAYVTIIVHNNNSVSCTWYGLLSPDWLACQSFLWSHPCWCLATHILSIYHSVGRYSLLHPLPELVSKIMDMSSTLAIRVLYSKLSEWTTESRTQQQKMIWGQCFQIVRVIRNPRQRSTICDGLHFAEHSI